MFSQILDYFKLSRQELTSADVIIGSVHMALG